MNLRNDSNVNSKGEGISADSLIRIQPFSVYQLTRVLMWK
jgi:hypothetical protein